jgi:hypothetical protein
MVMTLLGALMVCFAIQGDFFSMWVTFWCGVGAWFLTVILQVINKTVEAKKKL